jgi:hypothetical protein
METGQTTAERSIKSKQLGLATDAVYTAAAAHGALRQLAGFDLMQLVGEFRALRAIFDGPDSQRLTSTRRGRSLFDEADIRS